jgi:hypothetical protein
VFDKVVITAACDIDWSGVLPDGTDLNDPLRSVQIEVGYPDFSQPFKEDKDPNLQFRTTGVPINGDGNDADQPAQLAVWTKENPHMVFKFAFLKLADSVPGWDADEVMIRKTLAYDPSDPRVDLSTAGATYVNEIRTKGWSPIISREEVGYVYVRFSPDRRIPNDAVSMTLTCTIGSRTDTLKITAANQKNVLWQVFSDKYINETSFTYELKVNVTGPGIQDEPIAWETPEPVAVDLPAVRIKYLSHLHLTIPPPPADKVATINQYIKAYSGPPA